MTLDDPIGHEHGHEARTCCRVNSVCVRVCVCVVDKVLNKRGKRTEGIYATEKGEKGKKEVKPKRTRRKKQNKGTNKGTNKTPSNTPTAYPLARTSVQSLSII